MKPMFHICQEYLTNIPTHNSLHSELCIEGWIEDQIKGRIEDWITGHIKGCITGQIEG